MKLDIHKLVKDIILQGITRNELNFLQSCISDGEVVENGVTIRTNDFPQWIASLVEGSPVARACYRVRQNFIKGDGFTLPVGKLQTGCYSELFHTTFENVSNDFELLDRFAILVKYEWNITGYQISSFSHLPAEYCRYSLPSENGEVRTLVYNPYFNTTEETLRKQYVIYPLFAPNEVEESKALFEMCNGHNPHAEFGQVIFYNLTTPINRTYSRPDITSAENAMLADSLLWKFHTANLKNNGFLGGIMNVYGDPDKPVSTDEHEFSRVTVGEEFERKVRDLFSGAGNAGTLLVNWLMNPTDQPAQFTAFQSNDNDSKFTELPAQLKETITTAFNVPSVLANIQQAGKLGNTQEVELAIKQMNANIKARQALLEGQFTYLLQSVYNADLECKIIPISPVLEVPQYIFAALTPEQQSAYIEKNYGIKPTTNENGTTENPPN